MAYPLDVTIQGLALETLGFTANNTIAGLGLNTFGFLWPCDGIWTPTDFPIVTVWSECSLPPGTNTVEYCNE